MSMHVPVALQYVCPLGQQCPLLQSGVEPLHVTLYVPHEHTPCPWEEMMQV
jgi:hypothetical protein